VQVYRRAAAAEASAAAARAAAEQSQARHDQALITEAGSAVMAAAPVVSAAPAAATLLRAQPPASLGMEEEEEEEEGSGAPPGPGAMPGGTHLGRHTPSPVPASNTMDIDLPSLGEGETPFSPGVLARLQTPGVAQVLLGQCWEVVTSSSPTIPGPLRLSVLHHLLLPLLRLAPLRHRAAWFTAHMPRLHKLLMPDGRQESEPLLARRAGAYILVEACYQVGRVGGDSPESSRDAWP
jgi:hypothetical protein